MGNRDSKDNGKSADDVRNNAVFLHLSKNKSTIQKDDLKVAWQDKIDRELYNILENSLYNSNKDLTFNSYNEFANALTKGTYDEKAEWIIRCIGNDEYVEEKNLLLFVSGLIRTVLLVEKEALRKWNCEEVNVVPSHLAQYLISLAGVTSSKYSNRDVCAILVSLDTLIIVVFNNLLGRTAANQGSLFPRWLRLSGDSGKILNRCSLLTSQDILFLNLELPVDYQQEWRLLFSTQIHGESFSRFSGQIMNQGPTILIIKDKDGHIFGSFCPASWSLNPNFVGDSSSFLFSLKPEMSICPASNFNENFQYMNLGQQTLPNGLGMGGRLEYFGLWLDGEFGRGVCNDSCTTYRQFKRLSKQKEFICDSVEVWGVGKPPPTAAELGERSVLDGNSDLKAILEMAGKKTYSEGLREEPKD